MAEFYAVPHSEMEEFLRQRRFVPVELSYRNRPVKEWVYERKLPRSPGHWVRVYTGINRYGRNAGDSRKSGKDAIRVQVIYRDGLGETLVSQPKRVHRVSGWAENLDKRLKEVAEKLPRVAYDSRGQPMTLRKGKSGYFWGSRDYPRYKETRPFNSESAPLAGQTTEAPYEIKVYVPSTDLDQPVSENEFQSRIDETQEKLSELFGGFTTTVGDGGYLSQEEGLISEPVMIVTTWANPEEYLGKLDQLEDFLQQKQQDWGQEVIGFEFENDFFMFPEFSAEWDPEWMKSPEKKREIFLKLQKEDGVPRICEVCESAYSGLYRYPEDDEIFVVCRDCVKQSELEWGDMFGFKPDWTGERGGKPLSVINTKNAPDMSAGSVLLISGAIGFAMGIILGR